MAKDKKPPNNTQQNSPQISAAEQRKLEDEFWKKNAEAVQRNIDRFFGVRQTPESPRQR